MNNLALIVCAIIISILLIVIFNTRSVEDKFLSGFWSAEASFLEESGLNSFLIHIDEPSNGSRPGYILAINDEGIIINEPVEFILSGGLSINPFVCSQRNFDVTINWVNGESCPHFPTNQTLQYYPLMGKLVFVQDDTITAVLYKDFVTTDIVAYRAENKPAEE